MKRLVEVERQRENVLPSPSLYGLRRVVSHTPSTQTKCLLPSHLPTGPQHSHDTSVSFVDVSPVDESGSSTFRGQRREGGTLYPEECRSVVDEGRLPRRRHGGRERPRVEGTRFTSHIVLLHHVFPTPYPSLRSGRVGLSLPSPSTICLCPTPPPSLLGSFAPELWGRDDLRTLGSLS